MSDLPKYKAWLRDIEQKLSEHFDKTMLLVSGGALGLSITFVKDIIGDGKMVAGELLVTSWATLTLCLIVILWSFHLALKAYRKAQDQVEQGVIKDETPGGNYSKLLDILNSLSICLLSVGLVCLFTFSYLNLSKESSVAQPSNPAPTPPQQPVPPPPPTPNTDRPVKDAPIKPPRP